ncbi:DNA-directed RNA polymerase I subunit RPA34 isoform X2 [Sphaeramia orbicularis]|nr:DNA-directed RNA polymerase I subunit RPA34 isoform X2 [Sphaeramia orbicularis]
MRYQCPADFVSFSHKTCSSTLTNALKKNHAELWLIKAPSSFNPERFRGLQVPLSGLQTLKVPAAEGGASTGADHQIYSVLASTHGTSDLHLLTKAHPSSDAAVFGPAFSGQLNICETYGDANANQNPQVVPATPAPTIPPGLKQRFHPFGSKTPRLTCVAESEVDGAAYGPSSATLRPLVMKRFIEETRAEEEDEEGRRRKKKKKEKRIKTELPDDVDALVRVKTEPAMALRDEMMAERFPFEEDTALDERRKKKKKKKDREREEVEEGLEPSVRVKQEEVTVKCEPVDTSYGDGMDGKKKKKKKKKNKTDDD